MTKKAAFALNREGAIEVLFGHLHDGLFHDQPGVVDRDVEPPERRVGLGEQAPHLGDAPQVRRHHDRAPPRLRHEARRLLGVPLRARAVVVHDDVRAAPRERLGERAPHVPARSR